MYAGREVQRVRMIKSLIRVHVRVEKCSYADAIGSNDCFVPSIAMSLSRNWQKTTNAFQLLVLLT